MFMSGYKINDFWCYIFGCIDKIVFIFVVFVIYYNDYFFCFNIMDGFINGIELKIFLFSYV